MTIQRDRSVSRLRRTLCAAAAHVPVLLLATLIFGLQPLAAQALHVAVYGDEAQQRALHDTAALMDSPDAPGE